MKEQMSHRMLRRNVRAPGDERAIGSETVQDMLTTSRATGWIRCHQEVP